MFSLYQHIKERNPNGIPFAEAVQLFLWAYCTVDVLPVELRALRLTRKELVEAFAKLAADRIIANLPEDGAGAALWEDLLKDLLTDRVRPDPSFPTRISRYV